MNRIPLMRILLVDNGSRVLSALRLVVEGEPGMTVVGEATDLPRLLAHLERYLPDLLLLDWELRGLQPVTLLPRLRERYPPLKVVVLSSHPEARLPALAAGVDAFVSKGDAPERLLLALHRLAAS